MDLRWLAFESRSNPETGEHFLMPSTYKKLQCRERQRGTQYLHADGNVYEYGEWKDVPTVSEEFAAKDSRQKEGQ